MPRDLLIIFVKAPRPGDVKTRIAQVIGREAACHAYVMIVEAFLGNLQTVLDVQIRYSPDDAFPDIRRWVQSKWTSAGQGPGDLGERLVSAFRDGFASGAERVVVIGSDAPDITREDIESAWQALATHDVVIGPAEDGGYWLIGLRAEQPSLFENMPWSSPTMFQETVARAHAAKLSIHTLRQLCDIDTVEDLRRFQARSAQQ